MDDYIAFCWGCITLLTAIVFIIFGPATVFDAIVGGFKSILGGTIW